MISSIFGKTKPINYIIVLAFLFVFYWFVHFFMFQKSYAPGQLLVHTAIVATLLFSLFVLDFIVKRNKITGANTYALLFYTLLIIAFPEVLTDSNAVFCGFFFLLGIRRLLSIKSLKDIRYKIFDATLWIIVASLFYDWAVLFLILVFVAIYFYEPKNIRNWLVPLVGIFTVFMITFCILILADNQDFLKNHYTFSIDVNTHYFLDPGNGTKLIVYILTVTFASLIGFVRLGKSGMGKIIAMRLIALSFTIGLLLTVLESSHDAFPVMVTFFPTAIFITNYVESIKRPNIKEILLITSVLLTFSVLISSLIMNK